MTLDIHDITTAMEAGVVISEKLFDSPLLQNDNVDTKSYAQLMDRLFSTNRRLVAPELAQKTDDCRENIACYEAIPSAAEHTYGGFELATKYAGCDDIDQLLEAAARRIQERLLEKGSR